MSELNREEIIKALEWCIDTWDCGNCPMSGTGRCHIDTKALALIKELIEENERLRGDKKVLTNNNAELKNKIQEEIAEEDINLFDEFTKLLQEGINKTKADTVRKMQERLKAIKPLSITTEYGYDFEGVELKYIDQIVKEMLEG